MSGILCHQWVSTHPSASEKHQKSGLELSGTIISVDWRSVCGSRLSFKTVRLLINAIRDSLTADRMWLKLTRAVVKLQDSIKTPSRHQIGASIFSPRLSGYVFVLERKLPLTSFHFYFGQRWLSARINRILVFLLSGKIRTTRESMCACVFKAAKRGQY